MPTLAVFQLYHVMPTLAVFQLYHGDANFSSISAIPWCDTAYTTDTTGYKQYCSNIISIYSTVKPVYKGRSRELELYVLFIKWMK